MERVSIQSDIGLCATCMHVRVVRSDRGSTFYQCTLAATNPRFRKYPALPVLRCVGYERVEKAVEDQASEGYGNS